MRKHFFILSLSACLLLMDRTGTAAEQTVKITLLGARTGDLCVGDVALLFEDPSGVRILYDPGVTVAGGSDSRLGDVHAILISHFHFDHIGDRKLAESPDAPTASCNATFPTTPSPNSNTAEIAAAKNAAVLAGWPMHQFLRGKIANIRGATSACPQNLTHELIVPRTSPCDYHMSFGTRVTITQSPGTAGVQAAMVHAQHDDTIAGPIVTDSLRTPLRENGLDGGYGGSPNGYVLVFTNGLKVYLSGDTGPTSDMLNIVHGFYDVNLAIVNVDGYYVMGPEEAAYAVRNLIQPQAVIVTHVQGRATDNGIVRPGTGTARLLELLPDFPVFVPLSGRTMEFDGDANCVAGCRP